MDPQAAADQGSAGGNPMNPLPPGGIALDDDAFARLSRLVLERAGIELKPGKESLVQARLAKRMRELGLNRIEDYLARIEGDRSGEETVVLLDAISTNTTQFFREAAAIDFGRVQLERWLAAGQRRFRIWCAAASTGEEPFTLAMVADRAIRQARCGPVDLAILATDISTRVLARCREALYPERSLEQVPREYRDCFVRQGEVWRIEDRLRSLLTFNRLNLAKPPFPLKGPLDLVYCRNVMIYFGDAVRRGLLAEVHRVLRPDGFLMVGAAESLTGTLGGFKAVKPSIYAPV